MELQIYYDRFYFVHCISFQSAIEELTHEQCKELLFEAASKQPALLMDFFHAADGHYSPPRPPAPSGNAPIWCTCSHCREMPTDLERLCCGKIPERCLAMKPVCINTCTENINSQNYSNIARFTTFDSIQAYNL